MKKGESVLKGFTIIEVSLVLAIGGLILLMVFIALPGLRVSQRDTQRRENIMEFLEKVKNFQTNNRGALPGLSENNTTVSWSDAKDIYTNSETTWKGFYHDYLGEVFLDPSGVNYKLVVMNCDAVGADAECKKTGNYNKEIENIYKASFPNEYKLLVVKQATCYGDKAVGSGNPRKLAVLYKLEGAGVYCNNT